MKRISIQLLLVIAVIIAVLWTLKAQKGGGFSLEGFAGDNGLPWWAWLLIALVVAALFYFFGPLVLSAFGF